MKLSLSSKQCWIGLCLLTGVAIAAFFIFRFYTYSYRNHLFECAPYPFINHTIDCTIINDELSRTKALDTTVQWIISEEKNVEHITTASVFYRDLTTRRWFGINETENFYAASLLKLPLAMIYYKIAEIDPNILDQTITLPEEEAHANEAQFFQPARVFKTGQEYTIRELIKGMLEYSDNTPLAALNNFISPQIRAEILHDMGIEFINDDPTQPQQEINVKQYSNILRQLYNGSYLTIEYSNLLLEYLSHTTFSQGITAGVPEDITVSHKFGEAYITQESTEQVHVLHDCGIVYRPEKPYILCVMTKGRNPQQSALSVKRISEAIYNF